MLNSVVPLCGIAAADWGAEQLMVELVGVEADYARPDAVCGDESGVDVAADRCS